MEYQGGAWRVKSQLPGGSQISLDLEAPGDQKAPFVEGNVIHLELPVDRIRVFPAKGA